MEKAKFKLELLMKVHGYTDVQVRRGHQYHREYGRSSTVRYEGWGPLLEEGQ